jgi:NADH dehydrogenase FAD-containing subunit
MIFQDLISTFINTSPIKTPSSKNNGNDNSNDNSNDKNKEHILLLGNGFFARGFLHNINYNKFHVSQIYRDPFINPQDIIYSLQRNERYSPYNFMHLRDIFNCKIQKKINMTITSLKFKSNPDKTALVNINDQDIKGYKHIVVGLGSQKSLHDWSKEINGYVSHKFRQIGIVGMGPSGIELGTILSKNNYITMYEFLPKEKAIGYVSPKYKNFLLDHLLDKKIVYNFEKIFDKNQAFHDNIIFCVGNKPNQLIPSDFKINKFMQSELYNNVYIGGDCINSGYIKTAQVAYQQGAYVAKRLNGDIPKDQPFEYKPNGVLINIGNKKVIIEGHKIIPDGVYPDFVVKLYSLFFI